MGAANFLTYEKKKIILPVVLILLLVFVLAINSIYKEQAEKDSEYVVQAAMNTLKLTVYNASLRGTEPLIESMLENELNNAKYASKKAENLIVLIAASYVPEYVISTFGPNFCAGKMFESTGSYECKMTDMDAVLPSFAIKLAGCSAAFTTKVSNVSTPEGEIFKSNDIERIRSFVLSEKGQNILKYTEGCGLTGNVIFDEKISKTPLYYNLPMLLEAPKMPVVKQIQTTDILMYAVILLVVGYIISCFILWIHRKNTTLSGAGKKTYLLMMVVFVVIFWLIEPIKTELRLKIISSIIVAYTIVTAAYLFYGNKKESKIVKNTSKRRKPNVK